MGNTFKTAFLLTAMTLLLMVAGRALGWTTRHADGACLRRRHEFCFLFFLRQDCTRHVPRASRSRAKNLPRVYNIVERLSQKVGLPMPKVYVIPNDSPNAFATGRNPNHASVAVTHGILGLLNDEELEGVLAHELGTRPQSRHPDQFRRCDARRRDYLSRVDGALGNDFRRLRRRPR